MIVKAPPGRLYLPSRASAGFRDRRTAVSAAMARRSITIRAGVATSSISTAHGSKARRASRPIRRPTGPTAPLPTRSPNIGCRRSEPARRCAGGRRALRRTSVLRRGMVVSGRPPPVRLRRTRRCDWICPRICGLSSRSGRRPKTAIGSATRSTPITGSFWAKPTTPASPSWSATQPGESRRGTSSGSTYAGYLVCRPILLGRSRSAPAGHRQRALGAGRTQGYGGRLPFGNARHVFVSGPGILSAVRLSPLWRARLPAVAPPLFFVEAADLGGVGEPCQTVPRVGQGRAVRRGTGCPARKRAAALGIAGRAARTRARYSRGLPGARGGRGTRDRRCGRGDRGQLGSTRFCQGAKC